MDSNATARVKKWLVNVLYRDPNECGAIFFNIRELARKGGFDVDRRFAHAGLSAGPEGRIAASIVDRAMCGGDGRGTSLYSIRQMVDHWVNTTRPMGF